MKERQDNTRKKLKVSLGILRGDRRSVLFYMETSGVLQLEATMENSIYEKKPTWDGKRGHPFGEFLPFLVLDERQLDVISRLRGGVGGGSRKSRRWNLGTTEIDSSPAG